MVRLIRKGISKLAPYSDLVLYLLFVSILLALSYYVILFRPLAGTGFPFAGETIVLLFAVSSWVATAAFLVRVVGREALASLLKGGPRRGAKPKRRPKVRRAPALKPEEKYTFKEVYEVIPPYAFVGISIEDGRAIYRVIEPELSKEEEAVKKKIEELLFEELKVDVAEFPSKKEAEKYLKGEVRRVVRKHRLRVSPESLGKIMYYLVRDRIYLGKIEVPLRDVNVEDIGCPGPGFPVYVWHRFYEYLPSNIVFDERELDNFVIKLAYISGRHVSVATPVIDATLPDGTRVQVTFGKEVTRKGSSFSIRKFRKEPFTVVDLIDFGTLSPEMAAFFWYIVEKNTCLLVVGGTASGKTTTLNALSLFIRPESKIVTIEDTAELNLPHKNWVSLVERTGFGVRGSEAEIRMFELLKMAVRQRPDYIIVGEVRGEEAYTLFQAMATGHGGLGTLHAESVKAAIDRLTTEPMNIPPRLIPTVNVIAVESKVRRERKIFRKIVHVGEPFFDPKSGEIRVNDVYRWDPATDEFKRVGESLTLKRLAQREGKSISEVYDEIERRKAIIEWMILKNIRSFKEVSDVIMTYYTNPERVLTHARVELLVGGYERGEKSS